MLPTFYMYALVKQLFSVAHPVGLHFIHIAITRIVHIHQKKNFLTFFSLTEFFAID